jgi:sterol desaturase/sphingolipid hydroxylase (fatty acid hydroxylase superfamily)
MNSFLHEVAHLVFSKVTLVGVVLLAARLVILTALEKRDPAHVVAYGEVLPKDLLATLAIGFGVFPISNFLNHWIMYEPALPRSVLEWPLAIRFALYLVLAGFGHYWVHKLLHTRHLWRAHKWHHAPTYMYWLAGVRASIVQQTLVNIPYIAAGVFLSIAPWWMFWAILLKNMVQNDFMHLNRWWGNRWLEWIIVTPRYHHIHHSDDPAHYRSNLAAMFPIWDHLFGTYCDPETAPRDLTFGIGESVSPARLFIGV